MFYYLHAAAAYEVLRKGTLHAAYSSHPFTLICHSDKRATVSQNNTGGGKLIKLCDCPWKGLIKRRESEATAATAGHYYLYLDILKQVNLKSHGIRI